MYVDVDNKQKKRSPLEAAAKKVLLLVYVVIAIVQCCVTSAMKWEYLDIVNLLFEYGAYFSGCIALQLAISGGPKIRSCIR